MNKKIFFIHVLVVLAGMGVSSLMGCGEDSQENDTALNTDTTTETKDSTDSHSGVDSTSADDSDSDTVRYFDTETDSTSASDSDVIEEGNYCTNATDCGLRSDCCGCRAYPHNALTACMQSCLEEAQCEVNYITADRVLCHHGYCMIDAKCDDANVQCDMAVACGDDYVPEVDDNGTCYTGYCVYKYQCIDLFDQLY